MPRTSSIAMGRVLLNQEVRFLRGVGPARAGTLARLGIRTVEELLLHLPRSYLDWSRKTPVSHLRTGEAATVAGVITHVERVRRGRGRTREMLRAVLEDESGSIVLTFFNAGYLAKKLTRGTPVTATGRVEMYGGRTMAHPELGFLDDRTFRTYERQGILPVYPLTSGITQSWIRRTILQALDLCEGRVPEILPVDAALVPRGFDSREEALREAHVPTSLERAERAREVLALEELYLHQVLLLGLRESASAEEGISMSAGLPALPAFLSRLDFRLTDAQRRSLDEILEDMTSGAPMRRLLQGDVGCGKTVVAAAACRVCAAAGFQSAFLAPTEVLAEQHGHTLESLLEGSGLRCELLTGGSDRTQRQRLAGMLEGGESILVVGTHALLEPGVRLPGLGLVVIDEQHKWGVEQRQRLLEGLGPRPDMLVMSATPIPRTLAMTLYGDLSVSVIDELPPGRGEVETRIVPPHRDRTAIVDLLEERLEQGERAYIVYPLREATENEDLRDARSAWEALRQGRLGRFGVGLLHGAMSSSDKAGASSSFRSGETGVLVCTVVVEVGLDVPEATVMIIANAERFGLSQLHQLRGRIGRSGRRGWCLLMPGEGAGEAGMRRLEALVSTSDGFELAWKDLELRGPGEVLGTRQHGLPVFGIADLVTDSDLVPEARGIAASHAHDRELVETAAARFESYREPSV